MPLDQTRATLWVGKRIMARMDKGSGIGSTGKEIVKGRGDWAVGTPRIGSVAKEGKPTRGGRYEMAGVKAVGKAPRSG